MEVSLGRLAEARRGRIVLDSNPECDLKDIRLDVVAAQSPALLPIQARDPSKEEQVFQSLALLHSPFLVVRPDQYLNRLTDLPLLLGYSVHPGQNQKNISLRYTFFFTDEDSETTASQTEGHMAQYGRRTDVEWLYEVEFNDRLEVVRTNYHSDLLMGIGHIRTEFRGKYLPNSSHPILYNIANHNVFADAPRRTQKNHVLEGYHLVPRYRFDPPRAREWAMFDHPWMFEVSDVELEREGKLSHPSNEYIYALFEGELLQGSFLGKINIRRGLSSVSGNGEDEVNVIGEDLWEKQSFTALHIGKERIQAILAGKAHGEFSLYSRSFWAPLLKVTSFRFFRLKPGKDPYEVRKLEEITDRFQCAYSGLKTKCSF
jgi:hypothetical protein